MRFAFLAGLPRSGSTLLASLLNQHPDVYASPSSPICDLMWTASEQYLSSEQATAYPQAGATGRITRGILSGFYAERAEAVVVDKCWTWGTPGNVAVLREALGADPRLIITTRPLVEVLASFVRLMRETPGSLLEAPASRLPVDDARCDWLARPGGDIDRALWGIQYAREQGIALEVPYRHLVTRTDAVMADVWDFLDVTPVAPNVDAVFNVVRENDVAAYGLPTLHEVRPVVADTSPDPEAVLSDYVLSKYGATVI